MVESEKIKESYLLLLELVKIESELNTSIWEYYSYLNDYREKFTDNLNISLKEELREFLRGANRYSDEFSFSDKNYSQIRTITNSIYDALNAENISE